MLDQIFQDYCDRVIDGNEKLAEVYGTYTNTPVRWLKCEDITVKNLVNRICDDFEEAGHDLNEVPIETIREKFLETSVEVDTPSQYLGLNDAKLYVEEKLANFHAIEAFQNHPERETVQKNLKEALDTIINKMKELM